MPAALVVPAALFCVQLRVSEPATVVPALMLIVAVPPSDKVPVALLRVPLVVEQENAADAVPFNVALVAAPAVRLAARPVMVGALAAATKVTVAALAALVPATLVAVLVMVTEAADGEVKAIELVVPSDESTPALPPALVMVPGLLVVHE